MESGLLADQPANELDQQRGTTVYASIAICDNWDNNFSHNLNFRCHLKFSVYLRSLGSSYGSTSKFSITALT